VAETTVNKTAMLLVSMLLVKRWDKCINALEDMSRSVSGSNITCFTFYICDLCT
jgi:hypothetical protein